MKRSAINGYLKHAIEFLAAHDFHLPLWAYWSPADWRKAGPEADEIRRRMLGWDVTDFGSGDYARCGLLLFTLRNGVMTDHPDPMAKNYCEKMLLVGEGQVTPTHFHFSKMEDIINRAGGKLVMELWHKDAADGLDRARPVEVSVDGIATTVAAGTPLVLAPGQSVTLPPYMYHRFYAAAGGGYALCGEVSRVNDDARDNRFLEPLPRFPAIEEDVQPTHLLCTEYPKAGTRD